MTHPGKIAFYDAGQAEPTKIVAAETVPDSIKFIQTESGLIPVVKIVSFLAEDRRIIRQYGPDDQLLNSTVQFLNP